MGTAFTGRSCRAAEIGLTCGHAYALLEAVHFSADYPQAVKMYNPWGSDYYAGALKSANSREDDGIFFMTFDEYIKYATLTDIAEVLDDAVVSSIALHRKTQRDTVLEFEMKSEEPFAVQFEWPSWRFIQEKGCKVSEPHFTVAVAKKNSLQDYKLVVKHNMQMTNARLKLQGSGEYVVFVNARFPNSEQWLKDFVINVYGPPTKLVPSPRYLQQLKPIDAFLAMNGLCREISFPRVGTMKLDEGKEYKGMPTFKGSRYSLVWDAQVQFTTRQGFSRNGHNKWILVDSVEDYSQTGQYYTVPGGKTGLPAGISCAGSLLQDEVALIEDSEKEMAFQPFTVFQNSLWDEESTESRTDVSMGVNVEASCGKAVDRLSSLNNGPSIASSGTDALFPEVERTIAKPGTNCGDSARNIFKPCSIYDKWKSINGAPEAERTVAPTPQPTPEPIIRTPPPTASPAGSKIIELGPSLDDTKCAKIPPNSYCYATVYPSGNWGMTGDMEKYCVTVIGGWKENVKLRCESWGFDLGYS